MDSTPELTPDPKPKNVLVARADEQLSHVYEQIARADEQLARVTEQLASMERDGAANPSPEPTPPPEPAPQPSPGRPARIGLIGIGLLAAACFFGIVVAALASQWSRGGIKSAVTRWAPQLVSASSRRPEKPPLPAQPDPSPIQVAAAETVIAQAAPQAAPSAQIAPQDAVPTATTAAPSTAAAAPAAAGSNPEPTQSLQAMARTLARLEQSIAELKTKQDQMASDYAKAIEQLKARQEDMTRRLSVSAHSSAPRASPPPPRLALPRRARERERERPLTPPAYWDDYYEPW
jgi:uncharacterized coiled-coil protein SlyX